MSAVNLNELSARIDSANVYALAKRTPLELAEKLSAKYGRNIWLKREDTQDVFSFKIRGATNRIAGMSDADRARGVCAASAGNHAQGVAAAASYYKTAALIFMPVTTPAIKVEAVEAGGAQTRLVGDNYDEACEAAIEYANESGAVFIHPFDEVEVIAGQGTVAKEIFEQTPRAPSAIYVCVGGGGFISGIGTWSKTKSPATQIISCEPVGAATLKTSLEHGKVTPLDHIDGFADGVAVKQIGALTYQICEHVVDRCVTVTNDEISAAVKAIFETTRTVVEPAGALALASLIKDIGEGTAPEGDVVVTVSGANVNFDRIGHIVERAELGADREMLFATTLPEERGAFQRFVAFLHGRAVSEFNYRFADNQSEARILVGLKLSGGEAEAQALTTALDEAGYDTLDLSDDRLAKRHLRHMVGGRASRDVREALYRFEFPERPGALMDFLSAIGGKWNISLFHYRNHGSAIGQVLCGFQVPNGDVEDLEAALASTGYPMNNESGNAAFEMFLRA